MAETLAEAKERARQPQQPMDCLKCGTRMLGSRIAEDHWRFMCPKCGAVRNLYTEVCVVSAAGQAAKGSG